MSGRDDPPPATDRDLTLELIAVTSQRARAAQRELAGVPPATEPLPHPLTTSANLHHYLTEATLHQDQTDKLASTDTSAGVGAGSAAGLRERIGRVARWAGPDAPSEQARRAQAGYNRAIVHVIHQLDHRSRLQELTIARLEAELAETRRALVEITAELAERHRPS